MTNTTDDFDQGPRARLGWSAGVVALLAVGALLLACGTVGLVYFLAMDTRAFAGTRVPWTVGYFQNPLTNLELAQMQQTGVIFSAIGASMGLFVTSLGVYFLRFGGRRD